MDCEKRNSCKLMGVSRDLFEENKTLKSICKSQENQIRMLQKLVEVQKKFLNFDRDEDTKKLKEVSEKALSKTFESSKLNNEG